MARVTRRWTALLLASVALAAGASRATARGAGQVALQIGRERFSPADLEIRARIAVETYGAVPDPALAALAQLVEGYLAAAALEKLGAPLRREDIDREAERIRSGTRAPERLARIVAACGGADTETFRRLYVVPILATRRLSFEVFPTLPVHERARYEAQRKLAALQSRVATGEPIDLAAVARRDPRWSFRRFDIDTADPNQAPLDARFSSLARGALPPRVAEGESGISLARWTALDGRVRHCEEIVLPKPSRDDVLRELVGRVPVRIPDLAVRERFRRTVSWAARVRLEPSARDDGPPAPARELVRALPAPEARGSASERARQEPAP